MIIIINKSYTVSALILCAFMLPALSAFRLNWPESIEIMIFVFLVSAGVFHMRRYGLLLSGKSINMLSLDSGLLSISLKASPDHMESCNVDQPYVGRHVVVARLKGLRTGQKYNLLLIRGMCANDDFRKLKKWLCSGSVLNDSQSVVSGSGTSTVSQGGPPAISG